MLRLSIRHTVGIALRTQMGLVDRCSCKSACDMSLLADCTPHEWCLRPGAHTSQEQGTTLILLPLGCLCLYGCLRPTMPDYQPGFGVHRGIRCRTFDLCERIETVEFVFTGLAEEFMHSERCRCDRTRRRRQFTSLTTALYTGQ